MRSNAISPVVPHTPARRQSEAKGAPTAKPLLEPFSRKHANPQATPVHADAMLRRVTNTLFGRPSGHEEPTTVRGSLIGYRREPSSQGHRNMDPAIVNRQENMAWMAGWEQDWIEAFNQPQPMGSPRVQRPVQQVAQHPIQQPVQQPVQQPAQQPIQPQVGAQRAFQLI
ncbi:hypothetical protein ACSFA3_01735 [Variovorax sp. RHLX14]|uniref:hypothetical protein n=1 Tax=Variovorax sp. RHLX14 TaxID=1259731 RepID=UPI003F47EF0D